MKENIITIIWIELMIIAGLITEITGNLWMVGPITGVAVIGLMFIDYYFGVDTRDEEEARQASFLYFLQPL